MSAEASRAGSAPPAVSVVIPAFNAARTIATQLEALTGQEDAPEFEVVVADNRSTDDTAEVAERFAGQLELRVVAAFEYQGVNCARNTGIAAAKAECIVLIDADDVVGPRFLAEITGPFDDDPRLGIVGGAGDSGNGPETELRICQGHLGYVLGAALAVRREVFDAVGGFDPHFVGGHDEVDFCWRAQHAGYGITVAPEAVFTYVQRADDRAAFHQYRRYGFTYAQLYAKHRHRGITGGSLRSEMHLLRGTLRDLPRFVRARGAERAAMARGFGWTLGRWTGDLRLRVLAPR